MPADVEDGSQPSAKTDDTSESMDAKAQHAAICYRQTGDPGRPIEVLLITTRYRSLGDTERLTQETLPKLAVCRAYQPGVFALPIEPRTDIRQESRSILHPSEEKAYAFELRFAAGE